MRKVLAALIAVVGIAFAVYVGLWIMFVGGISQIIDAVQEDPIEGGEVAWGIARVVFASAATAFVMWVSLAVAALVAGLRERF